MDHPHWVELRVRNSFILTLQHKYFTQIVLYISRCLLYVITFCIITHKHVFYAGTLKQLRCLTVYNQVRVF